MSARTKFTTVGIAVLALLSGLSIYLLALSPSEKWLLFSSAEAESYAQLTLSGQSPEKGPLAEKFIDVVIVTNVKEQTVLFSPHENHDVAVIYAPGRTTEQINYEQHAAKRIRGNWYALF